MHRRVAIARSLAAFQPKMFLYDEPTSGLDPVFRRELLGLLGDLLQDERVSVLFSTHITADLERTADYITFLSDGRVVFSRSKDEVLGTFGVVKGGRDLLDEGAAGLFDGIRVREHGFEALTSRVDDVRRRFGDRAAIERATLEDVMVLMERRVTVLRELLLRDWRLNGRAVLINLSLFAAFQVYFVMRLDSSRGWLVFASFYAAFLILTVFAREDKFRSAAGTCTLPVSRRDIVWARFVGAWLQVAGALAVAVVLAVVIPGSRVDLAAVIRPETLLLAATVATLVIALMLPFTIRFGILGVMIVLIAAQALGALVIAMGVDLANQAYRNSEMAMQLRLVRAAEVAYTETGDINTYLVRLPSKSDGFMDQVTHCEPIQGRYGGAHRRQRGQLLRYCLRDGKRPESQFCRLGIRVTDRDCVSNNTLTHELGHNMGDAHNRASGGTGVYPYSYGYRDPIGKFRTIMAYAYPTVSFPRMKYFSNPKILINGRPAGIDHRVNPSNSADNARSIPLGSAAAARAFGDPVPVAIQRCDRGGI